MLDLENRVLVLKLYDNYEIKLKLLIPEERARKFLSWRNYELVAKYDSGRYWVSICFRKTAKLRAPKTVTTIDINFDNVMLAVFSRTGRLLRIKRFETLFSEVLTHKIRI